MPRAGQASLGGPVSYVSRERSKGTRHEAQRIEILEAAAAAIAEHGYHGMTMRGLARATGKSLASFYNYFSSKEDLLFSLQTEAFETLTSSLKAALEDVEQPVERLYVFIFNHLRFLVEHRSIMRVLVHEASALPPGRRRRVRLVKERYFEIGRDVVASVLATRRSSPGADAAAVLDPAEVERVTYSVFGMLNWSYGWYEPQRHGTPQDIARTIHCVAVCGMGARCPHRAAQQGLERYLGATAAPPLIGRPAPIVVPPCLGLDKVKAERVSE
jgi:TetR/AcrR family transcriptional regulator